MSDILCNVEHIESLTPVVSRVVLHPAEPLAFKPGQYLQVIMGANDKRPFSIANAPREDARIELHIGAGADNRYAGEVLEAMQAEGKVHVDGGHGKAYVRDAAPHPTMLVAGGTGFSYTYSILQHLIERNGHEPIFLYWGTRSLEDMYAYDVLCEMQKRVKHFEFIPVIENPPEDWRGKTGWVHKAVLEDFVSLEPYKVYIAGRFEMAGVAREDFHNKGLMLNNLFGDAFEFI